MDLPLEDIQTQYGLAVSFVAKVAEGRLSDNYVVTAGGTNYFLKKHRHKEKAMVEVVCRAEQFFADGGIPVILPLLTNAGDAFFEHAGRYYSLYPFVAGRHLSRGTLTEPAAISLGATLARLHRCGKESNLEVPFRFRAWDTAKFLNSADAIEAEIRKQPSLSEFDTLTLESLALKREKALENTIRYGDLNLQADHLIHGDYFCDNVFFDAEDRLAWVFDFEKIQYAPPLTELFRSLFVNFLSIPAEGNLALAKQYVDAYLAEYPFPQDIVRKSFTAAYLRQIHSLWIEEEHYLRANTRADDILPSQVVLTRYCAQNRQALETCLID